MKMKDYESWDKKSLIAECKKLLKWKKFGLVWEDKPEDVVEQCKEQLPVLEEVADKELQYIDSDDFNYIIEGDNFHALSVLSYTHAGKVDVIYIDPPYNTGASDWKYNNDYIDKNDTFRHSKWISMMNNRLKLCRRLLKDDGVLVVTIDHNEQENLGILLRETFPDMEIVCVTIVHNPAGIQGQNFSYTHEFAFFIFPKGGRFIGQEIREGEDVDIRNFRDVTGADSLRTAAKTCFYPILVKEGKVIGFGDVSPDDYHPPINVARKDGVLEVYPVDPQGVERKWRFSRNTVENIQDELIAHEIRGRDVVDIKRVKNKFNFKTVWTHSKYSANNHGTQLLNKMLGKDTFSYPKSLYAVVDCIRAASNEKKDALILDFFAGSGTTGHAALELNRTDKGHRKFILCTNNENQIAESVTFPRIKTVFEGYEDVKGIPANLKYFKTAFVKKSDVSDDTRRELVTKSTEMICLKESTFKKVANNKRYKIYRNNSRVTGILFDLDSIDEFKKKLDKLDTDTSIYVFTLTNDVFSDDFLDLTVKHEIRPIPEGILEVYRRIFK